MKPALRRLVRGERTLQFGVHPLRAVVLTDVEPAVREVIDALDGTATVPDIVERARRHGLGETAVRELIGLLGRCGALDDASIRPEALNDLPLAERDRLAPDLDELSLAYRPGEGGLGDSGEADGGHGHADGVPAHAGRACGGHANEGPAYTGQVEGGHADEGPAHTQHAHTGHVDTGSAHTRHADARHTDEGPTYARHADAGHADGGLGGRGLGGGGLGDCGLGDGGLGAMRRRRVARVRVYGAGRVGAQVVALLAAAGVGHLCVVDPGTARRRDLVPGGLGWEQVGGRRDEGAVAVARRAAPGVNAWSGRGAAQLGDDARRPDLVVLAPVGPLDGVLVRELTELGVPHLLAAAFEGVGSVGPLVLPGRTACLGCLDLVRRDRDPDWPMLSARLGGFPAGEIACGAALSAVVAAYTAGHALAFVDGRESRVTGAALDVLPDWRWRRRSWKPHPHCGRCRNTRGSRRMVA